MTDSAMRSTSRSGFPFCAPASTTAPRCPSRAAARPTPGACARRWRWQSIWRANQRAMALRKRFGQHFLHDRAVITRIIDALAPARGERIVEIGPGRGALTWDLLERAGEMDAIEIDRDLAAELAADLRGRGRLRI